MSNSTGFLQVYNLVLTTRAPLFIGDGKTILKKFYLYDSRTNQVSIFDEEKFFSLLFRKNLVDPFEKFMLGRFDNLFTFFTKECHPEERAKHPGRAAPAGHRRGDPLSGMRMVWIYGSTLPRMAAPLPQGRRRTISAA